MASTTADVMCTEYYHAVGWCCRIVIVAGQGYVGEGPLDAERVVVLRTAHGSDSFTVDTKGTGSQERTVHFGKRLPVLCDWRKSSSVAWRGVAWRARRSGPGICRTPFRAGEVELCIGDHDGWIVGDRRGRGC